MRNPVVVGVAASQSSVEAVDWASDEAWLREAPLRLVHAWFGEAAHAPRVSGPDSARRRAPVCWRRHASRSGSGTPASTSSPSWWTTTRGRPWPRRPGARCSWSSARGARGLPRLLLGSTSLQAAAHAACPVIVVHPAEAGSDGGVLVGVQGRGHDDEVLDYAFDSARRRNLPLLAVHAWAYPLVAGPAHDLPLVYEEADIADEHERLLAEVLAGRRERFPEVTVTATTVRSNPARELVAGSQTQRLVVVGRHGGPRGPLGRLGSTSQAVVRHAGCPVVVVPG